MPLRPVGPLLAYRIRSSRVNPPHADARTGCQTRDQHAQRRAGPERECAYAANHAAIVPALASRRLREQKVEERLDVESIDAAGRVDMGADEFGSFAFGDMNCDERFDAFDIETFLVALFNPDEYAIQFPDCDINLADMNRDAFQTRI